VAGRLHVRAYDHDKRRFADFVMTRIITCGVRAQQGYVDARRDTDWLEHALIELAVKPDEDNQATRLDYAMGESGVRRERVRRALVGYLIDERREGFTDPVSVRHLT
jgi:predicted DNA-binding transcriptional regulator YafY